MTPTKSGPELPPSRGQNLAGPLRPEGMTRVPPIDPVEHVGKLCRRNGNHPVRRRRPDELAVLQPLGVERHAEAVMPENLDEIAAPSSENIQIAGMRIA